MNSIWIPRSPWLNGIVRAFVQSLCIICTLDTASSTSIDSSFVITFECADRNLDLYEINKTFDDLISSYGFVTADIANGKNNELRKVLLKIEIIGIDRLGRYISFYGIPTERSRFVIGLKIPPKLPRSGDLEEKLGNFVQGLAGCHILAADKHENPNLSDSDYDAFINTQRNTIDKYKPKS